jgi:hypothetical protein
MLENEADLDVNENKDEELNLDNAVETETEVDSALNEGDSEDEVVISIEGESLPPDEVEDESKAPDWVKDLRKQHRELVKKNKELETELEKAKPKEPEITLPAKPTLADCDYDADEFETRIEKWHSQKLAFEAKQKADEEAKESEKKIWQNKLDNYGKLKSELKVKDFETAEEVVKVSLNNVQQGIIVDVVENPAVLVYALGKNEKLLKELASLKPAQFAHALGKLETKLKITEKKSPPAMRIPNGNGNGNGVDSTLERLRAEAEKTGDMTKVIAYKKQLKNKS